MSLILIALGFVWGLYFAYNKMEEILLAQVGVAVDQSIETVSQELSSSLDSSTAELSNWWGTLDMQVDDFIQQQKANLTAKLEAEKDKLKENVSNQIKEYLNNKVNVLFWTTSEE